MNTYNDGDGDTLPDTKSCPSVSEEIESEDSTLSCDKLNFGRIVLHTTPHITNTNTTTTDSNSTLHDIIKPLFSYTL